MSVKVADCARCGTLVSSQTFAERQADEAGHTISELAGRVYGRPYCVPCFNIERAKSARASR